MVHLISQIQVGIYMVDLIPHSLVVVASAHEIAHFAAGMSEVDVFLLEQAG